MREHTKIQWAVENWLRRSDIEFETLHEREMAIGRITRKIQAEREV